jgi:hypothetical protein
MIGTTGDLVSISFHANKNITSAEGGCLVLNDEDEARRCELWRLQGVRSGDSWDGMDVTLAGGKHNLTDIAACIGLGQLAPHLAAFTARRRELARRYFARFDRSLGCELPLEDFTHSNWHMFQVLLPPAPARTVFISACALPASASACTTRRSTCSRCTGSWASSPAIFRTPSASGRARSACRCSRRWRQRRRSRARGHAPRWRRDRAGAKRRMSIASRISVVIPVYNEEEGCRRCSRGCTRRSMRSAAATRSSSSTTAAAIAPRRCCASSSSARPT